MKWCCVIPSNRPEQLKEFKEAWKDLFERYEVNLIVVEDSPEGWAGIPDFIPRGTDMIRSWGFYLAWQTDCDYILTLDDDTRPIGDIFHEYEVQFLMGAPLSQYLSVSALTDAFSEMRGFPYKDRKLQEVGVQYGGWCGVLDYDAVTQLSVPPTDSRFYGINMPVPKGVPVTTCIMNTAFRRELTPIMWQLPLYEGKYNRFGDIWSGLFIKKYLDAQGKVMMINGKASIRHERASDPFNNLKREAPGLPLNENIWDNLHGESYREITDSAIDYFAEHDKEYAIHFEDCRNKWLALFES